MDKIDRLAKDLKRLKRNVFFFQITTIVLLAALVYFFWNAPNDSDYQDTITTKRLVVQDENGNDRIIISPKISLSDTRQRTDTLEGILILDKHGIDRVVLGATPTIQVSGEVVPRWQNSVPYGLAFNDKLGNERGGFGYYDSRDYVSFGMDFSTGEGLNMFVAEKGHYGQKVGLVMQAQDKGQVIYLGSSENLETMLNFDAPGKGRVSLTIDSTGESNIKHFDYMEDKSKTLLNSK